jgi:UDP-galactopyranose mutase
MKKVLIVGSGFSGAVIAEQLSRRKKYKITIWDDRDHIAGNCHTERDTDTGVMVHKYGPHIFHTSNEKVWNYIQNFGAFRPFVNRVKSVTEKGVYSLPINLHTINQFYGKAFNPEEARNFMASQGDTSILSPANFEEQALKFVGRDLYHTFFYGYTKKQWGTEPKNLPANILKRLPIRFNYDDNYYNDIFQGIPENGYTSIIKNMLDSPHINIELGKKFVRDIELEKNFDHIFYTGPIDEFFQFKYGRLGYRTVHFKEYRTSGDHQGNPVINYPQESIPYTRIHEHKRFTPWEFHDRTIYFLEFSKETEPKDIPGDPAKTPYY